jgi:GTPase SAR1 family protein
MDIIGVDFCIKELIFNERVIKLQFWVLSSKKFLTPLSKNFVKGSNVVILMFDITNQKSLINLTDYLQEFPEEIPFFLVGNKLDLEENREVTEEILEDFKQSHNITLSMEISAQTGEKVDQMFKEIAEITLKRYNHRYKSK